MFKLFITVILIIQIALIAFGIWQIQQTNPLTVGIGWFVIIMNVVFGGINIKNFFDA